MTALAAGCITMPHPFARLLPFAKALAASLPLLVAAGTSAHAQASVPPRGDLAAVAQLLERDIERVRREQHLPAVSIALVDDQQIVYARGFGFARPSDSTAATAETVYRVGSVSKLFTDIAVMQLVEQGRLDLDAPVTRYIPDFRPRDPFGKPITLRQLMAHRSGLVREPPIGSYFDSTSQSLAATIRSLNTTKLVYPPETRTKYSNAAIATVGYVIERTQNEPFAKYLDRAVLRPLGLTHSAFQPTPEVTRDLASATMWTVDGRSFTAPTFQLGIAPAGSMYSTVLDLGRFMSALFAGGRGANGQLLSSQSLAQMWTPQFAPSNADAGYGIGFRLGKFDGHRSVGHDGAIYGFATTLQALPDDKLGVVVITTMDGANAAVDRIADIALRGLLAAKAGGVAQAGRAMSLGDSTTAMQRDRARGLVGRYQAGSREVELVRRGTGLALASTRGGGLPELRARGDTLVQDDVVFGAGEQFLPLADSTGRLLTGPRLTDTLARAPSRFPAEAPTKWRGVIGEYGPNYDILYVYERDGKLWALIEWFFPYPLTEVSRDTFNFPPYGLYDGEKLVFTRDAAGRATQVQAAGVRFARRAIEPRPGTTQLRITPLRPVPVLRTEALAAQPPQETTAKRAPDLVEPTRLDSTVKLEIRYATSNNFLGTKVYEQARAFLQRPAAEALVRVHRSLRAQGYGLLIHDAYRPWYVTKIFWDATPPDKRWLVANPAEGSKHNRGAAVDLTLYDVRTGKPVEMVSTYDESTERAYAEYPGGTSRQRWLRELLRQAMEREGFVANPQEWWHFDYKDWREYPLGNATFARIR